MSDETPTVTDSVIGGPAALKAEDDVEAPMINEIEKDNDERPEKLQNVVDPENPYKSSSFLNRMLTKSMSFEHGASENYNESRPYVGRNAVLHIEYMSDTTTKRLLFAQRFIILVALGILIWEAWYKQAKGDEGMTESNALLVLNLVIAPVCLATLLIVAVFFFWNVHKTEKLGLHWNVYRRKYMIHYAVELTVQIINVIFYIVPNAVAFANEQCGWFLLPVHICGVIRWTCWNTLFCMSIIHVRNFMPATSKLGISRRNVQAKYDGKLIVERSFWVHWPELLFLWVPTEVVIILLGLDVTGVISSAAVCNSIYDTGCYPVETGVDCHEWDYACSVKGSVWAFSYLTGIFVLIQIVVYFVLVWFVFKQLRNRPYSLYRVSNIELRLQLQTRIIAAIFFLVCIIYFWFAQNQSTGCNAYLMTWLGLTPMQLVMTSLVVFNSIISQPIVPTAAQIKLHNWLQDFAWTEAEQLEKLKSKDRPVENEPLFCVETALKALYWSMLVYDDMQDTTEGIDFTTALGMYNLKHHEEFWDKKNDCKCVMAWNKEERTVVLSFRGTVSMANVLADLKVWRSAHPPKRRERGRLLAHPMVHHGFLLSYRGIKKPVFKKLEDIMSGTNREEWRVMLFGHSLGGALANLASYDVAKLFQEDGDDTSKSGFSNVTLYTYGCPRVGNHSYARDYAETVSDCWDVFHSNDPVANGGKFFVLYKRAAHRCIVTKSGDLVIRPSLIESTAQKAPLSMPQHYLTKYQHSFGRVIRDQLRGKAVKGHDALLQLLDNNKGLVAQGIRIAAGMRQETLDRLTASVAAAQASSIQQSGEQKSDADVSVSEADHNVATGKRVRTAPSREESIVSKCSRCGNIHCTCAE